MNPQLLTVLLEQLVLPMVMTAIRAHQNATGGKMPTDAQVIAALALDTDRAIAIGQSWLAAHPQ